VSVVTQIFAFTTVFHKYKDILWVAMMLMNTSINRSFSKSVGDSEGGGVEIRQKRPISSRFKDISDLMFLMGDKVFKYILKFSLRFTECCYKIICLY